MSISLICPICKSELAKSPFENLYENILCKDCKTEYPTYNGCADLVPKYTSEREYYDKEYDKDLLSKKKHLNFEEFGDIWEDPSLPERGIFLDQLKKYDLTNKIVLLLGNGESLKELYLLKLGAKVIYSDLSINSVSKIKNGFIFEDYKERMAFHAIDANSIPLSNESIDVLVGYAFVHHLENIDPFLAEVHRVLKPGGLCLFMDGAYSRVWQKLKFSILKPIVFYSHRRWGISPEDLRSTYEGGYYFDDLDRLRNKYNFSDMIFIRSGFFSYIFFRGVEKLVGLNDLTWDINRKIVPILFYIDNYLKDRSERFHNNTIRLVWGFKK